MSENIEVDLATGLPIGMKVDPTPAKRPERGPLRGQYVTLLPLKVHEHGDSLWEAVRDEKNDGLWLYLFEGPFRRREDFDASLYGMEVSQDPFYFAIMDNATARCTGRASYLRIDPNNRSIEVGSILYSPLLQKTAGATEAMFLMMDHAFEDLGYRRYEWKCNALNAPSRKAALRLGFQFEGIFRQHMIQKGRNRDTAWYSILDAEWPDRKKAFEAWLEPENFDVSGRQKRALVEFMAGS
jgi:RimJ/RimL family protein N-acetyltransferase